MTMQVDRPAGSAADPTLSAIIDRMPPGQPLNLAADALTLLVANAVAVYYLVIGEMTPLELVVLVALEALALTVIARGQRMLVPAAARIRPEPGQGSPAFKLVFGVAWLLVMYALVFWMFFDVGAEVAAALADPIAFLWQPQIRWPLALTLLGALVDAAGDHAWFTRHGGLFVSTVEFNGMARLLTLLLGAVPFFVPMLLLVIGISVLIKRFERRQLAAGAMAFPRAVLVLAALLGALSVGMAALIGGLFAAGVAGWAVGYISAKLASEAAVVALPNLITRMVEDRDGNREPAA
jgi:Ca2+/Na+ antiporter